MITNKETKQLICDDETQKEEPPEITLRKRQFERIKKSNNDQRKIVNMLASLSAVLFLICFIMGTGLVQNEERISKLENELQTLNNSYAQTNTKNNNAESVFSMQETPQVIKNIEPSPEKTSKVLQTDSTTNNDETEKTSATPQIQQVMKNIEPSSENKSNDNQVPKTYVVKEGDSLSAISQKFFGNSSMINKIMELNGMDDADKIYAGKILKLPREF